jgi:hypothetical protein
MHDINILTGTDSSQYGSILLREWTGGGGRQQNSLNEGHGAIWENRAIYDTYILLGVDNHQHGNLSRGETGCNNVVSLLEGFFLKFDISPGFFYSY